MENKMYFVGKFEVLSLDFIILINKLLKNGGFSCVFVIKESENMDFDTKIQLINTTFQCNKILFKHYNENEIPANVKVVDVDKKYPVKFIKLKEIDTTFNYIKFILDNHLYVYNSIFEMMNEKRYKHSVSVALTALEIAKNNDLSVKKAFIGSILHDIAKDIDKYEQNNCMLKHFKKHLNEAELVYHQFVGTKIAAKVFKIRDKTIINSIKYHTTGRPRMSIYEKIVYCADKIDPNRGYDSKYMIDACNKDIMAGFNLVLHENYIFLTNKYANQYLKGMSQKTFEYYRVDKETLK